MDRGEDAVIIAQVVGGGYSLVQLIVFVIVLCGVIGIAAVVIRQTGVAIPAWIITVFWICVAVVVGVFAIRFLMGSV
jgi:uncharacterized protein (DUF983 family)